MKPHYVLRAITAEEWLGIRITRGVQATGYSHHTVSDFAPRGARRSWHVGKHYYWSMGMQPCDTTLGLIAHQDVDEAVRRFCQHFVAEPSLHVAYSFNQPTRRC